eukprot:3604549-Pyramimonas_sp.AAC.1
MVESHPCDAAARLHFYIPKDSEKADYVTLEISACPPKVGGPKVATTAKLYGQAYVFEPHQST